MTNVHKLVQNIKTLRNLVFEYEDERIETAICNEQLDFIHKL